MIKDTLVKELNDGFFNPIKYVLYFVFHRTGKRLTIQTDILDAARYSDVIEWCRVKLFDELNITILLNKEGKVIKYY